MYRSHTTFSFSFKNSWWAIRSIRNSTSLIAESIPSRLSLSACSDEKVGSLVHLKPSLLNFCWTNWDRVVLPDPSIPQNTIKIMTPYGSTCKDYYTPIFMIYGFGINIKVKFLKTFGGCQHILFDNCYKSFYS